MNKISAKCRNFIIRLKLKKTSRAFTLMEIIIALAIIAILTGAIIVAINPGRQMAQSRNVQRDSDLHALQYAIQQYYLENREYPAELNGTLQDICREGMVDDSCIDLTKYLVPNYISALPHDPQATASSTIYQIAINPTSGTIELTAPNSTEYGMDPVQLGTTTLSTKYVLGSALSFDGVNDYINCGNEDSLNFGIENFSVAAWIKTEPGYLPPVWGSIVIKAMPNTPPYQGYYLAINNDGRLFWRIGDDLGNSSRLYVSPSTYNFSDGDWHFVVGVADRSGDSVLYIDGVSRASGSLSSVTGSITNNNKMNIGNINGSSRYFKGSIDEVSIFNRSLSSTEVFDLYNLGSGVYTNSSAEGLVAGYHFDEGDGTVAIDITGNNNGAIINGATYVEGIIDMPVL